jgi:CRISPR/Cas system CSM-associated protein Csm4 (group 5 of RAMP superfamily)
MGIIDSRELYDVYRLKLRLVEKLAGGVPKNPDLIRSWVEASTGYKDEKSEELTEAALEQQIDTVSEKSWNGFFRDEQKGLYIEARCVKAMFKECASVLRITTQKLGSKQILQHGFEVKSLDGGARIYLGKQKPDGFDESPIHVVTPQGPRTAIKRVDYVENVDLEFEVWVLTTAAQEKRHVGEDDLKRMLALGQENGLGADRSQGQGKFEVVEFEKVSSGAQPPAPPKKKGKAA